MHRFWSILFFLVPIVGTIHIVWAMMGWWPFANHWLPRDHSEHGQSIDALYNIILVLTGIIFVATGLAIGWIIWKDGAPHSFAQYFHGNQLLELGLAIIPAIILVFLSFYQLQAWDDQRIHRPKRVVAGKEEPLPPFVRVTARQFGWDFHYAGADELYGTDDDIHANTVMFVPQGESLVIQLESSDVLHSFFVPSLRIKQDIVPGMVQFVWFKGIQPGKLDLACAELCGWGHYKMRGQVNIVSRVEFDKWYAEQLELQFASRGTGESSDFTEPDASELK